MKRPRNAERAMIGIAWGVLLIIVGLTIAVIAATANAQSQPGDTPPPMPDVFEVGLISASITCPPSVEACSVLVLDVSGTSPGERRLEFRPSVPTAAIRYDSGGELIYVWIKKARPYAAWWTVTTRDDVATDEVRFTVLPVGDEPPPDPDDPDDDPSPEDAAFMDYIRNLTEEVRADNQEEVAATFRGIAARIDAGNLQASRAIEGATVKALFGPSEKVNGEWRAWWMSLKNHLIHAKALDSDAEWSRHYRLIARSLDDD